MSGRSPNRETDCRRAREVARELRQRFNLEARLSPYRAYRWSGRLEGTAQLHLDDVSAIPFLVDIAGVDEYQHRARLRAGPGHYVAAVTGATEGFEDYCRDRLGLGSVTFVRPPAGDNRLAVAAACAAPAVVGDLAAAARRAGGMLIHPYMGIEPVWTLARQVAASAAVPVQVLSPPPPVTWVANDKALFEQVVTAVLGPSWLVESRCSRRPADLAAALLELGEDHPRVGLKRLRCASAMGNLVFDSKRLRREGRARTVVEVERFLERTEWRGDEDVLAVVWEETDLSPSTQLWVPPLGQGDPHLDGIYEQILQGEARVFVGSRPSRLPTSLHEELERAAIQVGAALQELGYVGRCSFDHLVVGDPLGEHRLRFTECNGRWGGTSTPMSFLDRLFPGGRPPYRAQDFVDKRLIGTSFVRLLSRIGPEAFSVTSGSGCFLFYNVGPLVPFGKLDVVAFGASQEEAELAMERELPARLGL